MTTVEAVCIIFPSGETVWCEKNQVKVSEITDRWVRENPRYAASGCSMSACAIVMPKADFQRVCKEQRSSVIWMP